MPDSFGRRLQQLREKAGLTQQSLADASGVNLWTIRGYEQDRREPNWKVAIQLAQALGASVEAFADCVSKEEEQPAKKMGRKPAANRSTAKKQPRKAP